VTASASPPELVPFMTEPMNFKCPTCNASYKVVRAEAPPTHDNQLLLCLSCGGPLRNREGKFALKYFRVGDRAKLRVNGRKPNLR
jgi:predicted Zn finger-like uncharacterized protein